MVTLETLHKEMKQMRSELDLLRNVVAEDYPLSDKAQAELDEARVTMDHGDYVNHEDIVKRYG